MSAAEENLDDAPQTTSPPEDEDAGRLPPPITDTELDRAFATEFGTPLGKDDPVRPFLRATETIYRRYLDAFDSLTRDFARDLEAYRRQDGPLTWLFVAILILQLVTIGLLYLRP